MSEQTDRAYEEMPARAVHRQDASKPKERNVRLVMVILLMLELVAIVLGWITLERSRDDYE